METIHYSRCRMVPTPSALSSALGLLSDWGPGKPETAVQVEFGDFDHKDDRLWMRHAGSTKGTWARSDGADTRVVALSGWQSHEPVHVLAASEIRRVEDLRGRRVAVPRVPGRVFDVDRHVFLVPLHVCLSSAGMGLQHVELVDALFERPKIQDAGTVEPVNFFEHAADLFATQLFEGHVDAFVGPLPPHLVADARLRVLYDPRTDPRPMARGEQRALTVSGALLREHRHVVVQAVARLLQAGRWAATHPDQVAGHVARELHVRPGALAARQIDFGDWSTIDCIPEQIDRLRARKDALLAMGSLHRDFDVLAWVDPDVVREARALQPT